MSRCRSSCACTPNGTDRGHGLQNVPGTWLTVWHRIGRQEVVPDALERDDEDAGASAIRGGCGGGTLLDDGVVPALRDQPGDRIQMARALRRRRSGRPEGSLSRADQLPSPDRSRSGRALSRRPSSSSLLGTQEADSVVGSPTRPSLARTQHRRRDSQAARSGQRPPPPTPCRPPGPPNNPSHATQPALDGRLQGPVQNQRRQLLLPTHRRRFLQPISPRLPSSFLNEDLGHQSRLPARLPRVRPAPSHSHRQRHTLRRCHGHRATLPPLRLVDPLRHPPRTDPTLPSRTKRLPRTYASHLEGRDHSPPLSQPVRSAEEIRKLPSRVQRGTTSRTPQPEITRPALRPFSKALSRSTPRTPIPRSLRSPQSQQERRHTLEKRLDQHQPLAARAKRRTRRSPRRRLVPLLRSPTPGQIPRRQTPTPCSQTRLRFARFEKKGDPKTVKDVPGLNC